jgi:hypothetical protein
LPRKLNVRATFRGFETDSAKKGAAVARGSKVDNREASNRVDRSHSMYRRWTITVMKEKA